MLLLPGLIAGQIYYSTFQIKEVSVSKRLLDSLCFSFLIYLCVTTIHPWEQLARVKNVNGDISLSFTPSNKLIWFTLLGTIVVPLIIGFAYYSDTFHRILRYFNITTKTSRGNTWNDAFSTQHRYVIVTLKDDRRIRGYPTMFSTEPAEGYLYLYNPAWVNDDKSSEDEPDYFESNCHGFLLNKDNIDLIEFTLDPGEELKSHKKVK